MLKSNQKACKKKLYKKSKKFIPILLETIYLIRLASRNKKAKSRF